MNTKHSIIKGLHCIRQSCFNARIKIILREEIFCYFVKHETPQSI